jgi:acyl-CoA synthetase (AMP-forming)/AMP-acid ligase II
MIATPFALISSYSTPFELKHALTLSKATSLFVDAKFLPAVLHVAKEVGVPLNKVFVLAGHMKGRKSLSDLVKYVKAKSMPTVAVRQAKKDTLAYLVFSSGTSGLPKGKVPGRSTIDADIRLLSCDDISWEHYLLAGSGVSSPASGGQSIYRL